MKLLCLFFSSLSFVFAYGQDDMIPLKNLFLRGNLKSVRMIPYVVQEKEDGSLEKSVFKGILYDQNIFIKFNRAGKIIEKTYYNNQNTPISKEKISYDRKNRMTKRRMYNEKGKKWQTLFITYEEDMREEKTYYDKKKDIFRNTLCKLDGRGNPTSCITYMSSGKNLEIMYAQYDDFGNLIDKIFLTPEKEKKYIYHWEYNISGGLTKAVMEDYVDFKSNYQLSYFYKDSNMPFQQSMSSNGTLPAYSDLHFTFDKEGNWVRKEVRYKDKLVYVVELVLSYYR